MGAKVPAVLDYILHERARADLPVAPPVGSPHDGCLKDSRMTEENRFNVDRDSTVSTRQDNDVIGPVLHFDVPIIVSHPQVPSPEPASIKGRFMTVLPRNMISPMVLPSAGTPSIVWGFLMSTCSVPKW